MIELTATLTILLLLAYLATFDISFKIIGYFLTTPFMSLGSEIDFSFLIS